MEDTDLNLDEQDNKNLVKVLPYWGICYKPEKKKKKGPDHWVSLLGGSWKQDCKKTKEKKTLIEIPRKLLATAEVTYL